MPDERLARWAARGSEAAFAVIFERHHQALHRYCHSIVGNGHDASDALQSTMLKAFRALPGETREITLRPWLYRIAHNESISLLRARRSDADLDAAAHVGDPATEGLIESRDRLRSLAADLERADRAGARGAAHARARRPGVRGDRGRAGDQRRGGQAERLREPLRAAGPAGGPRHGL